MLSRQKCLLPVCSLAFVALAVAAPQPVDRPDAPPREPLPPGTVARIGRARLRHQGSVISVAFAPDGKTFASAGGVDKLARLWDTATGKELRQFTGHTRGIQAIVFTPDGKSLVSGSHDTTIRLWDVASGKEVGQFIGHTGGILPVAVSRDGKLIASEAQDETVRIWELATGKELHQLPGHTSQGTSNVVFSPDSRTLASVGGDFVLRLWDVTTGKEVMKFDGHGDDVNSLDFSPDGKLLASAGNDQTIRLWDVATGKEVRKLTGHEKLGATVRFTPDGKKVVSGSLDCTIRVWDVASGKELVRMYGHTVVVSELAVSPDGKIVASADHALPNHNGIVRLWDIETGKELPQSGGLVLCAALSPDGKVLATAGADRTVRFWDADTGKSLETVLPTKAPAAELAFAPDGKTLYAGGEDNTLIRWDIVGGKVLREYDGVTSRPGELTVSPDGKLLAVIGQDLQLRIWDTETGKIHPRRLPPPAPDNTASASCAAFAPDSRHIAIGSNDRSNAVLFDLVTGREVRQFSTPAGVRQVIFSGDGRTLAVATWGEGTVLLFETATGLRRWSQTPPQTTAAALALSPDGRLLAAGCQDGKVRVWDVASDREPRILDAHGASLSFVGFGQRTLVSAGSDTRAFFWDVVPLRKNTRSFAVKLTPGELEALWSDLGSREADKSHDAVWGLASAPAYALPLLRERLLKALPADDARKIAKLIVQLDDDDFSVRESATQELMRIGKPAETAVRAELEKTASAEVRRRAEMILDSLKSGVSGTPETLRTPRALEVLEKVGTPDAQKLVEVLAKGPAGSPLTLEANATLKRMRR